MFIKNIASLIPIRKAAVQRFLVICTALALLNK